jgi:hypothetical protein
MPDAAAPKMSPSAQFEAAGGPSDRRVSKLWLLIAFALGFVPDAALQ